MEHIVQFAIGIEDERIKHEIQRDAKKQIIENIQKECKLALFNQNYGYYGEKNTPNEFFKEILIGFLAEHKEELLEIAGREIAERFIRSKAGREALQGAVKNE